MNINYTPLIQILEEIPDPRDSQGKRHPLSAVLSLICAAILCGQRSYSTIAEWGRNHAGELTEQLGFRHRKSPCATTLSNILKLIDLSLLQSKMGQWVDGLLEPSEAIAVDGKTLRGSKKQGADKYHLLAAISHSLGLPLMQVALSEKNNEITGMKDLLKRLICRGKILTMDAMHTQVDTAEKIVKGQGWSLKITK